MNHDDDLPAWRATPEIGAYLDLTDDLAATQKTRAPTWDFPIEQPAVDLRYPIAHEVIGLMTREITAATNAIHTLQIVRISETSRAHVEDPILIDATRAADAIRIARMVDAMGTPREKLAAIEAIGRTEYGEAVEIVRALGCMFRLVQCRAAGR